VASIVFGRRLTRPQGSFAFQRADLTEVVSVAVVGEVAAFRSWTHATAVFVYQDFTPWANRRWRESVERVTFVICGHTILYVRWVTVGPCLGIVRVKGVHTPQR
jgi:hypothetical protein